MTPKEVLEKFKIVKGRAEPRHEVIDVEGNFDRIVYNENGKFAGYLYNSEPSEPGKEKEKIAFSCLTANSRNSMTLSSCCLNMS